MKWTLIAFGMLASLFVVTSAEAATSSISLSGGTAQLGQSVTFATSYPKTVKNPSVEIDCFQNGSLVWGTIGATGDSYLLGGGSSPWLSNGGPADCVATLEDIYWKAKMEHKDVLASVSFTAAG